MSKADTIRQRFEETLIEVLNGRVAIDREGNAVTKDGEPVIVRPPAADLSVIRAYLKDQEPEKPDDKPTTGKPSGLLDEFLKARGSSTGLPFVPTPQ